MITISLRGVYASNGLYARKIVEALWREVHAEQWRSYNNIFCDLYSIERILNDRHKVMYWEHDSNGHGYTNIAIEELGSETEYKIEVHDDRITIKFIGAQYDKT